MSRVLKFSTVEGIRSTSSDAFMLFWEALNNQLADLGYKEALYGDARDAFYIHKLTATEALDWLLMMRGEL